ncbi:hypothetical protein [Thiocapsa roseopersicina]|uniref:Uncharacterized protein n=1 Tax=Thiocapsa roseopersicina TaxID=1058 RepID=A0A1H3A8E1_THIRO|nr:hypothetical protein [Thiocapsa roseopersicina]SDX25139.1 hypothetical protein SAMN05421783_11885 [Thiocapsa roseopersicina]
MSIVDKSNGLYSLLGALILSVSAVPAASSPVGPDDVHRGERSTFDYPEVPQHHRHMQRLLNNAFSYVDPGHRTIDPLSGYPVEGWNQEPANGLFLREFTQLTAIGAWIELLANIAAGHADNPYLSREAALDGLALAVATLRSDQLDPNLAAKGLLSNFMGFDGGERRGPLLESIERRRFIDTFGERDGQAIWSALSEKGWLQEEDAGRRGKIRRREGYGALHFDGALAPYADPTRQAAIMGLLDQRVVTVIFGDNANLTAALARAIGALLRPEIRDVPQAVALRDAMERVIEAQREGYAHLFDPQTGTFVFGWDATADRFVGWDDGRGNWVTGQMNYFINEFRGPLMFTVLRYGLPLAAIRNAGFKIKPYRQADGSDTYALAAWDGSAFQLLGLSLFMQESRNPAWRIALKTLVDIELDFSTRHGLPGLLSEAYSGKGTEYTGLIGIGDIAVTDDPLDTQAPSLYSLGVAYGIAPEEVDGFLRTEWARISSLFTDHGPWEGWNTATDEVIPYQTTAHTLSLILGGINTAHANMRRYLDARNLSGQLEALYAPGQRIDFLSAETRINPWTAHEDPIAFSRSAGAAGFASNITGSGGLAFVLPAGRAASLSNGRLSLRFGSETEIEDAVLAFKRATDDALPPPAIPIEIFARLPKTEAGTIEIVLPATPALQGISEVTLTFRSDEQPTAVELAIRAFDFVPFEAALEP